MLLEKNYLAFDIGGTTIKYGIVNSALTLTHLGSLPTQANQNHAIMKQLIQTTREVQTDYLLSGIGVSSAGIVDRDLGKIIYAGPTIPNYINTEIKKELQVQFDLPIYVENDVNAALLGEQLTGAAQNCDDVYCVALGTGIGGAYLTNGRLASGHYRQGNSIGYLGYDRQTQTTFEQRASTLALEATVQKTFNLDLPAAFKAAKNGNQAILSVINDWCFEIAQGLAQIILISDPALIIIGGGVSKQGDFLLNLISEKVPTYLPNNFFKTKIVVAKLFNDAALYGATYRFFK